MSVEGIPAEVHEIGMLCYDSATNSLVNVRHYLGEIVNYANFYNSSHGICSNLLRRHGMNQMGLRKMVRLLTQQWKVEEVVCVDDNVTDFLQLCSVSLPCRKMILPPWSVRAQSDSYQWVCEARFATKCVLGTNCHFHPFNGICAFYSALEWLVYDTGIYLVL